jgi:hypothetical protein
VPLVASSGSLAPLLAQVANAAQVADALHVAPVAFFTEAVREGFFGLVLGLAYPVLRARHYADQIGRQLKASPRGRPQDADAFSPT